MIGSARTHTHRQTGLRSAVTTPLIRERLASIIQRYALPPRPSPRLLRVRILSELFRRTSERRMEKEMVRRETRAKAVGKGQAVFISGTPGLVNQKLPSIKLELLLTCKMDVKASASEAGLM